MDKKMIKNSFMDVELTKLSETNIHLMGESRVDTIYKDISGNLWIDTWVNNSGNQIPTIFLRKELVDKIIKVYG